MEKEIRIKANLINNITTGLSNFRQSKKQNDESQVKYWLSIICLSIDLFEGIFTGQPSRVISEAKREINY